MRYSERKTIKVALTGGIGTGKSTVARMFKLLKIPIFNADKEAHNLLNNNREVKFFVSQVCPLAIKKDTVDRYILSSCVQKDASVLDGLENIMHPLIEQKRKEFCTHHHDKDLLIFEIPLLFEVGLEKNYDYIIVTACSEELQHRRVLSRPYMTPEKYALFSRRQYSLEEKKKRADYVIKTDYSRLETYRQIRQILINQCEKRLKASC